jgi:hypothetical protein
VLDELVDALEHGRGGCVAIEGRGVAPLVATPAHLCAIHLRASADEQLLAFAALGELCAPLGGLIEQLPPTQARALQGALAMGPPSGDALAVAVGFRSLLHLAAEREPLLVVVERAHLLDSGSAGVLAYAARRLEGPIGLVITQDVESPGALELPAARRVAAPMPSPPAVPAPPPADLEGALDRAEERGSAADRAAALEAAAHALGGDRRVDALLDAGQAWLDAGRVDRALTAAHEARGMQNGPEHAARTELLLGRIEAVLGNGRQSAAHLAAAADHAGDEHPEIGACALLLLVPPAMFAGRIDDADAALEQARARIRAAKVPDDDALAELLVAAETALALAAGRTLDVGPILSLASRVAGSPATAGDLSLLVTTVALPLLWAERGDVAEPLLQGLIGTLRARGAIGALPMPLCAMSVHERRVGRPTRSLIFATEARELAEQTGHRGALLFACSELANAHSLFGDVDRCRAAARVVLDAPLSRRSAYRASALSALATVELWSGDPAAVVELLEPLLGQDGALAPMVTLFHHTLVTAYVAVGRRRDAEQLLDLLRASAPSGDGRLQATVARCEGLLAPVDDRDRCFTEAIERAAYHPVAKAFTRLIYARRLIADGEVPRGVELLQELSDEVDENLLAAARAARLSLTRLGLVASGDPAWALLDPDELQVALAAAEHTPVLTLADRLRVSPPEIERLRDRVLAVVGARSGPEVAAGLTRPVAATPAAPPRVEIRLLGGLSVRIGGDPLPLPGGAASMTVALLALRRAVHVEELTDVLWPDAPPDVARRRLRNVLTRVRPAAGPNLLRHGERIVLAAEVVDDHHVLETQARQALATPEGPERVAALEAALALDQGPLLPELIYEDWAQLARSRAEVRHEELAEALERARDRA